MRWIQSLSGPHAVKEQVQPSQKNHQVAIWSCSISSIKQDIKKILLKFLDNGAHSLDMDSSEKILEQSKNILDNDKQKKLS